MKLNFWNPTSPPHLLVTALLCLGASLAHGAAPALTGSVAPRPLTPQELKDYSLTGKQGATGLETVGLGQPVYLDAVVNIAIAPSNITSVTWTLSNKPVGSAATIKSSPLGTNVPVYKIADRTVVQIAGTNGRAMLVPDVAGQYFVAVSITTIGGSGSTNLTQKITAGTYLGAQTCALCHSGGMVASNTYTPWLGTRHAVAFTEKIDGIGAPTFSKNCVSCHVTGYDTATNAVNGGFDDVAAAAGWVFPAMVTNGNWAAMPSSVKALANIQCESCHGPGSEHAYNLGDTNRISKTIIAGDCAQCHDSLTHHYKTAEWNNSGHAAPPRGHNQADCSRCHTAQGFINYVDRKTAVAVPDEAITCAACHDPHDASKPHQLRNVGPITLMDTTTTITNGGDGMLCMNCHMSRRNATNYVEITAGSSQFGPHHGPQSDMLYGVNAVTYGKFIPSSAHRDSVTNTCVACHMQSITSGTAFTHAGGHTFSLSWDTGTNVIQLTDSCKQCHGNITTFDLPRQDFDGNGIVEGVQTEVKGLMARLALLLPPVGTPKASLSISSSWTRQQLRAAYNYQFVLEDGSFGVHNLSYAVGLLKASIANLSGDANSDGLPDTWQTAYFGSTTSPNAAPNACPAGDGIPNWLKYVLGLNPSVSGAVLPDGVVWMNGSNLVNADTGTTNSVKIYTAAEVAFDTVVGKIYQIQGVSSLSGGWQNIGAPIAGTGGSVSYTTPTRKNAQMFFRVSSY